MSFTVKIVNNETGKIISDRSDITCIIGAFGWSGGTHELVAAECDGYTLCKTANAAEKSIEAVESETPPLKKTRKALRLVDEMMNDDTDSEDS
jgi:hypothetical protein